MHISTNHDSPGDCSSRCSIKLSPQEETLQSLCKQILKSRFFRGCYEERLYVDTVNDYRDIVGLHRTERELEKLLLDIKQKLQKFYQHMPDMWIGITHGALLGATVQPYTLGTHIWVQLDDIAFGQYWFNIRSVRFRNHEIVLKLKMIRPIETELFEPRRISSNCHASLASAKYAKRVDASGTGAEIKDGIPPIPPMAPATLNTDPAAEPQIGLHDFGDVVRNWGTTIKYTVYDFMSNDISKDNIREFLRFLGLVVISLLTGGIVAIKYLGTFLLRFMFEFSRFMHTMTPIVLKIIDVINKIIGGFYILVAMIWKDAFVNRRQPQQMPPQLPQPMPFDYGAIEYNRPLYKSIEYNVRPQQQPVSPHASLYRHNSSTHQTRYPEFERKCQ